MSNTSCHGIILFLGVAWMLTTDAQFLAAYRTMRARLVRNLRAWRAGR